MHKVKSFVMLTFVLDFNSFICICIPYDFDLNHTFVHICIYIYIYSNKKKSHMRDSFCQSKPPRMKILFAMKKAEERSFKNLVRPRVFLKTMSKECSLQFL